MSSVSHVLSAPGLSAANGGDERGEDSAHESSSARAMACEAIPADMIGPVYPQNETPLSL